MTVLDGFACWEIPFCTPVGGIINMINDGVNGLLAKNPSQEDIEEMLVRFLALGSKEVDAMKQNSKDSFRSFDMAVCAERYLQTINEL